MANDYKAQGKKIKEENEKSTWETTTAQKEENQKLHDEAYATAKADTTKQIEQTTDDYLDIVRSAEIQKELDLRDIRETRANMGLSRSGLSATEQTAAILSAGNKVGAAQRNRQQAIDTLNQSLLDYKNQLDTTLRTSNLELDNAAKSSIASFNAGVDQKVMELESDDYQAGLKAETERINAATAAEKTRKSDLQALFNADAIDSETYAYALTNGLTAAESLGLDKTQKYSMTNLDDLVQEFNVYNREYKRYYTPEERYKNLSIKLRNKYDAGEFNEEVWAYMLNYFGIDENGNPQ